MRAHHKLGSDMMRERWWTYLTLTLLFSTLLNIHLIREGGSIPFALLINAILPITLTLCGEVAEEAGAVWGYGLAVYIGYLGAAVTFMLLPVTSLIDLPTVSHLNIGVHAYEEIQISVKLISQVFLCMIYGLASLSIALVCVNLPFYCLDSTASTVNHLMLVRCFISIGVGLSAVFLVGTLSLQEEWSLEFLLVGFIPMYAAAFGMVQPSNETLKDV